MAGVRDLPVGIMTAGLVLVAGLWGGYATVSGSRGAAPASRETTVAASFFWLMVSASGATGW